MSTIPYVPSYRRSTSQVLNAIDVRADFGAVGNGIVDDALAFQAAINRLGSLGGGVLIVPEPSAPYMFGSTVNIPPSSNTGAASQISIIGTGRGCIISPLATCTGSLMSMTGKDTLFDGLTFSNVSSRAAVGLTMATSSADADWSATVWNSQFFNFQNGISLSGQNYSISNECWFQNNSTDINVTNDGRNTSINRNYSLGAKRFIKLGKTTTQAEGVRITDNVALATGSNGAHVEIDAGLEILIQGNIFDQAGTNTQTIYMSPTGGDAINKVKILDNWLNGGAGAYSIFGAGNTSNIKIKNNTIISNGALAGISLSGIQRIQIIDNDFDVQGGAPDLSFSSVSELTQHGNSSTQGASSNALAEILPFATSVPLLNITPGSAPASPTNGDIWTTSSGLFVRINGVTKTVTLT